MDILSILGLQRVEEARRQIARLQREIQRLERKVDILLREAGIEVEEKAEDPFPDMDDVRYLLSEGRKIEAIKVYRQRTGAGLKEAKDAVERMALQG
jgi:ribosomal protein L7/L12